MSVFNFIQEIISFGVVVPNARLVCVQQVFIEHVFDVDYVIMRPPSVTRDAFLWISVHLHTHLAQKRLEAPPATCRVAVDLAATTIHLRSSR
jgi:hypothetical protein